MLQRDTSVNTQGDLRVTVGVLPPGQSLWSSHSSSMLLADKILDKFTGSSHRASNISFRAPLVARCRLLHWKFGLSPPGINGGAPHHVPNAQGWMIGLSRQVMLNSSPQSRYLSSLEVHEVVTKF